MRRAPLFTRLFFGLLSLALLPIFSAPAHAQTSAPTSPFAGTYFGTVTAADGSSSYPASSFCLFIDQGGLAVCFGPMFGQISFPLDADGGFSYLRGASSGSIAGANAAFSFIGSITADGRCAATYYHPLGGTRLAFVATRSATTGPTATFAGYYRVGVVNSAATGTVVVDASGHAFAYLLTATQSDFGAGGIDAAGRIAINGYISLLSGAVRADGSLLLGFIPTDGSAPATFLGGRDDRANRERLINLSAFVSATPADPNPPMIGFVLSGSSSRQLLVRAAGPALAQFRVANPLADPALSLSSGTALVAANQGWEDEGPAAADFIRAAAQRTGAFPFPAGSRDSALLRTLPPGAYTAQVSSNSDAGTALLELYDATDAAPAERSLINLSVLARTGAGSAPVNAGFVIAGLLPKRVLVRGIGPGLAAFGVANPLAGPVLQLYDRTGAMIATNSNWNQPLVASASAQVGAFPLNGFSKDAAIVMNLLPGSYTVQLAGTTPPGVALLEIYDVP